MTTIKYEIDGVEVELEVEDEFATTYVQFCESEKKAAARYRWHKRKNLTDLDGIEEEGGQIEAPGSDFVDRCCDRADLADAIAQLSEEQREAIIRVYFDGKSQVDVARALGVSKMAITYRIQGALKKLKEILQS